MLVMQEQLLQRNKESSNAATIEVMLMMMLPHLQGHLLKKKPLVVSFSAFSIL